MIKIPSLCSENETLVSLFGGFRSGRSLCLQRETARLSQENRVVLANGESTVEHLVGRLGKLRAGMGNVTPALSTPDLNVANFDILMNITKAANARYLVIDTCSLRGDYGEVARMFRHIQQRALAGNVTVVVGFQENDSPHRGDDVLARIPKSDVIAQTSDVIWHTERTDDGFELALMAHREQAVTDKDVWAVSSRDIRSVLSGN